MIDLGEWGWWRFRGTWGFLRLWNIIEYRRFKDTLQRKIVWKLPLWVINWAVVREAVLVWNDGTCAGNITYRDMFNATDPTRRRVQEEEEEEVDSAD